MLSRPFYQPFNIIGSRVRSLACAAQITSDQERTRWDRSPPQLGPYPLCLPPTTIAPLYTCNTLRIFILPITSCQPFSERTRITREIPRGLKFSAYDIYESLKKCMNIITFESPLVKSPKIPCCDRIEISITESYTNFLALFVEINFYASHFVFDRIDLLNIPDASFLFMNSQMARERSWPTNHKIHFCRR